MLATQNKHKIQEIEAALKGLPCRGIDHSWHVEEGPVSLMENALLKAQAVSSLAKHGDIVLADDTGLYVPALGGAPGVLSSRYAGEEANFQDNTRKLLASMQSFVGSQRQAAFLTVMVAIFPNGRTLASCGRLEGEIVVEARGDYGFGYDPIFYVLRAKKTLAQVTFEEKIEMSHRTQAVKILLPYLSPK